MVCAENNEKSKLIVYSATRAQFTQDVFSNQIEQKILAALRLKAGFGTSLREIESWKNSMQYMNNVLLEGKIAEDAGVAIEYKVPLTSKRVDFILTGRDEQDCDTAIIVELKQWSDAKLTSKDAIVETWLGGAFREVAHPSYQAWTYAALIRDFNTAVQDGNIRLEACAYLHNCTADHVINAPCYSEHTQKAPAFLRADSAALRDFLRRYVRRGDRSRILYRIDHGRLRPSKSLADHLVSLLEGKREFEMIDDQKVVYESALALSQLATAGQKQVLLVEGGPGTGKSVVSINLLVEFTKRGLVTHYVTRNAAPRAVYLSKLTGSFTKTHINNLFKGSGCYVDAVPDLIDVLVVDEAHRLNEKSGLFQNQGENQVKEIIRAAKLSIFFIDEDQRVTFKDIGEKTEVRRWAEACGAAVTELKLESQFRCNGSDGYLAWLNHALQIHETANTTMDGIDYDFRVIDSPNELFNLLVARNAVANKARVVAGYCWDWRGKKDPIVKDVTIEEHGFAKRWNLDKDGSLWLIAPNSVNEVGCIHTCQGLELDYVGVIIGPDLVVRDGHVVTDAARRSRQDRSVHGYRTMLQRDPKRARELADRIIKNTYRTLMTRGQKGCYVYCVDGETNDWFRSFAPPIEPAADRRVADEVEDDGAE
jgi:uncharacterized protein